MRDFVINSLLRGVERAKLIDVGSGREGLVAGTLEHQDLDRAVTVRLLADLREPLIHREGKGVASLRPIEGDPADAVRRLEKEVIIR